MKKLTDRQMLTAAERALSEHLSTRPATASEAQAIANDHRRTGEYHRETAAQLRGLRPRTAAERIAANGGQRGQGCIDMQHEDGRAVCRANQQASLEDNLAARCDMHAEAWQRVADGPEGAAWEETRRELQGRVDYYRGLVEQR